MREIKFRAWGPKLGWAKSVCVFSDGSWSCTYCINGENIAGFGEFDGCILIQFTGLKDKNGVEIYEGDILDCSMIFEGETLPHRGEIVYDSEFGAFGTKNDAGITLLHNHCLHTLEVIGNIHENKDLLK